MEPSLTKYTMKIYWIGMITALMLVGNAQAQHVNIGIKGGLNIFNTYNDNDAEADYKAGLHAGLLGHIHLSEQFALQPELVFSIQGSQFTVGSTDFKLDLNYINVPLLLQYMFDNGFRIAAGPQLGLLLSAKSRAGDLEVDVKDSYENTDIGIGVGMSYVNPSSGFGIDARYNHGLTNINAAGTVNSFNRGFQVGVFYLFKHRS